MSFDTNWDIEKYKSPYECDDHWQLRKNFLIAHKEKYPEDQLVCLAQVFFNVELLGCKYPDETMQLIAGLSEGIADSYREKKRLKLQRTFVKASDAAGARIKGLSAVNKCTTTSCQNSVNFINNESNNHPPVTQNTNSQNQGIFFVPKSNVTETDTTNNSLNDLIILKNSDEDFFQHGIFIVDRTFSKKKFKLKYSFGTADCGKPKCTIFLDDEVIAVGSATSKVNSKKAACEKLLQHLQKTCFTLEEKSKIVSDGSTVNKNCSDTGNKPTTTPTLLENNVGNKIMKMMGWKGGGLGKSEQGLREPVAVQNRVSRSGFGVNLNQKQLMQKFADKLQSYAQTDTNFDLVFSSDFTKDERAKLHNIAQRFDLRTRSYGSGGDRHLVVSKKIKDHRAIIEALIQCGGENDRYKLIPPLELSKE